MVFYTITQCTTHENLKFILSIMHGCQVYVHHVILTLLMICKVQRMLYQRGNGLTVKFDLNECLKEN